MNVKSNLVYIIQDGTVDPDQLIKTLESYGGINSNNYTGNTQDFIYYIEPAHYSIMAIDSGCKSTVHLIKHFYNEIKVHKVKNEICIKNKLLFQLLKSFQLVELNDNEDNYKFVIEK